MRRQSTQYERMLGAFIAAAITAVCLPSAKAALVVEESFDYTAGPNLTQNGGTGWDGAWSTTGFGSSQFDVDGTNLSTNTLTTAGGSARRPTGDGTARAFREITSSSTSTLTSGSEAWFSILVQRNDENTGNEMAFVFGTDRLGTSSPPTMGSSGEGFGLFKPNNVFANNNTLEAAVWSGGTLTRSTGSFTGLTNGTTFLLAGRIEWNSSGTDDVLTLFKVPDTGTFDTQTATSITISADLTQGDFDTVSFWDNKEGRYDEIRLGESAGDVLPGMTVVPEPGAYALIGGLLALGAVMLRRRRSA